MQRATILICLWVFVEKVWLCPLGSAWKHLNPRLRQDYQANKNIRVKKNPSTTPCFRFIDLSPGVYWKYECRRGLKIQNIYTHWNLKVLFGIQFSLNANISLNYLLLFTQSHLFELTLTSFSNEIAFSHFKWKWQGFINDDITW